MTVRIAILGLGQIGASIGLALANHSDQVTTVGYDLSREVTQKAQALGVVDQIEHGLTAAVRAADVAVLALPLDQVRPTLQSLAGELRPEAVVMDTAPAKAAVAGWIKDLLPPDRHYVGLFPALSPSTLEDPSAGIDSARADLFKKGLIAVAAPAGCPEEAVQLAANLVTLLGAQPFFADLAELDGIAAAVQLLPGIAAAALLETVTGQPGWADIRKLTGRAFAAGTRPFDIEAPATLAAAAVQNRANALRLLDDYLAALGSLREAVAGGQAQELETRLERDQKTERQWRADRLQGDWLAQEMEDMEMPTAGDVLGRQIGGLGKLFRRGRRPDEQ